MNTLENNRLIAEFMGFEYVGKKITLNRHYSLSNIIKQELDNGFYPLAIMNRSTKLSYILGEGRYHLSWDWLMPVVEKIETVRDEDFWFINTTYHSKHEIAIKAEHNRRFVNIKVPVTTTRLEATYKAVIKFVNWHNKNK